MDQVEQAERDESRFNEPFIEALITAVRFALGEMAGAIVTVRSMQRTSHRRAPNDVEVVVAIHSTEPMSLILRFPKRSAAALAKRILDVTDEEVSAHLTADCLCEVGNVVAGQTKALLADTPRRCTFSIPRLADGACDEAWKDKARESVTISFDSDLGDFQFVVVKSL